MPYTGFSSKFPTFQSRLLLKAPLFLFLRFFGIYSKSLGAVKFEGSKRIIFLLQTLEGTAPVKLSTRYCFKTFLPFWLEHAFKKNGISLLSRFHPKTKTSDLSHLFYAVQKHAQYQVIVKLLGSFRLTALNRHLHRYCIFTELVPETVPQSLHHSCASELTRQGISLFYT